jgi:RNA polymerase sigma-70 factor (ECF subfamily)
LRERGRDAFIGDERAGPRGDSVVAQEWRQRRDGGGRDLLRRVSDQPVLAEPDLEVARTERPDQRDPQMFGQRRGHIGFARLLHRTMFARLVGNFGDRRRRTKHFGWLRCVLLVPATSARDCIPVTQQPVRSFDDFYRTEYPLLLRMLSAADLSAADALQDAFTKAATAWSRISRYDDPAAWVRHVAVRRMLNERRSMHRRAVAVETLAALSEADSVDRERLLDLAAAIDALPARQRVALTLFYLGGLTSAQTAAAMDISAGAVRFHLHQARNTLRETLGDDDE